MHSRPVQPGEWVLVSAHPPERAAQPVGILLIDVVHDELHVKFRNDWSGIVDEDKTEAWRELERNLAENATEMGAETLLSWLESTASHMIRIDIRKKLEVLDFEEVLNSLYREHIPLQLMGENSMGGHS
jgi:hypothetical protein